jgi:hypothetical protein
MTQTMFAPPSVEETAVEETPAAGGSRRTALVAGGVVAALALGAGGYFLLSGGSSEPTASTAPVHHFGVPAKTGAKPVVKTATKPAAQVPPTTSAPIGRDPFHALYVAPAAGDGAVAPAPATGTTATTTTTTSSSSGSTTTPAQPTQPVAPKTYKLVLTKVSAGTATFTVGGRYMAAKVGSVFGPTAELRLLDLTDTAKGWVATIQVGDGDPVDAPMGQALYVR